MASLTRNERNQLYFIAWLGVHTPNRWLNQKAIDRLVEQGLVVRTPVGAYEANQKGLDMLSHEARIALNRPRDYAQHTPESQWNIDQGLGILDWDGA